jgi:hypothetical protein
MHEDSDSSAISRDFVYIMRTLFFVVHGCIASLLPNKKCTS